MGTLARDDGTCNYFPSKSSRQPLRDWLRKSVEMNALRLRTFRSKAVKGRAGNPNEEQREIRLSMARSKSVKSFSGNPNEERRHPPTFPRNQDDGGRRITPIFPRPRGPGSQSQNIHVGLSTVASKA